jgi:hypothetical protein
VATLKVGPHKKYRRARDAFAVAKPGDTVILYEDPEGHDLGAGIPAGITLKTHGLARISMGRKPEPPPEEPEESTTVENVTEPPLATFRMIHGLALMKKG